jgi:hypothetical protein
MKPGRKGYLRDQYVTKETPEGTTVRYRKNTKPGRPVEMRIKPVVRDENGNIEYEIINGKRVYKHRNWENTDMLETRHSGANTLGNAYASGGNNRAGVPTLHVIRQAVGVRGKLEKNDFTEENYLKSCEFLDKKTRKHFIPGLNRHALVRTPGFKLSYAHEAELRRLDKRGEWKSLPPGSRQKWVSSHGYYEYRRNRVDASPKKLYRTQIMGVIAPFDHTKKTKKQSKQHPFAQTRYRIRPIR